MVERVVCIFNFSNMFSICLLSMVPVVEDLLHLWCLPTIDDKFRVIVARFYQLAIAGLGSE